MRKVALTVEENYTYNQIKRYVDQGGNFNAYTKLYFDANFKHFKILLKRHHPEIQQISHHPAGRF